METAERAPAAPGRPTAHDVPHMNNVWAWVSRLSLGRVALRGPAEPRTLYLTFDDGPNPEHTAALLEVLGRHQVQATFFLIGDQLQRHPDMACRLLQAGHCLGNHSMSHPFMQRLGPLAQLREIAQADAALGAIDGRRRHPFRPPRGRSTLTTLANSILRGQRTVLWTVDSLDFRLSPEQVVERLADWPLADGDVLLFHDDTASSWRALQVLLPRWLAAGWRFGTL